jgi:hypothetical protein
MSGSAYSACILWRYIAMVRLQRSLRSGCFDSAFGWNSGRWMMADWLVGYGCSGITSARDVSDETYDDVSSRYEFRSASIFLIHRTCTQHQALPTTLPGS